MCECNCQDKTQTLHNLQCAAFSICPWPAFQKTDFLFIGNERQRSKNTSLCFLSSFSLSKLTQQNLLRILELDKNFTFCSQISAVCSSCFYCIQDLQRIHSYLDLDSAKLLATALVSSRLDYCKKFNVFTVDWPALWPSHFIYLQFSTGLFPLLVTRKI